MNYQNWTPTVLGSNTKTTAKDLKNKALIDKNVHSVKKTEGSSNIDGRHMHKLLESESMEVPTVPIELRQAIVKHRIAKEWKQKDLAMHVGVKESIISAYESGKIVPDNAVIAKMEKVMACKLPRPHKVKL